MRVHKIKKGYDIPIFGRAEETRSEAPVPKRVALKPPDFQGIRPRLRVQVGDRVKIGSPLVEDKQNPRIVLVSPAGGQVVAINRGVRRRLEEVIVQAEAEEDAVDFTDRLGGREPDRLDRSEIIDLLLDSGMWPLIIQRPFAKVASPEKVPQAIFVSAHDTAPLAANPAFLLEGEESFFQLGLKVLARLTDGKIHLCVPDQVDPSLQCLEKPAVGEVHRFSGPHPAGTAGTHIHFVEPLRRGNVHWTLKAPDVALIGRFFAEGKFPVERWNAVAGEGARDRRYFKTRLGAPAEVLVAGGLAEGKQRFISGDVLTGTRIDPKGFIGFYDRVLTVIPEGGKREFLGWLKPGFAKSSFSKTFASSFTPKERYSFNTSLNGSLRAIVPIGSYEAVTPLDIQPTFLFKSIIYGDLEEAEKLGLLELAEEDVALFSYVCHSKIDFCSLLRRGLDQYEKEE